MVKFTPSAAQIKVARTWILLCGLLLVGACDFTAPPIPIRGPEILKGRLPPFTWTANIIGHENRLQAQPGEKWLLDFDVEVDLRAHEARYGQFTHLIVAVIGERQYDEAGGYCSGLSSNAVSSNFTTTGVAVEYFDGWPRLGKLHGSHGSPFEGFHSFEIDAKQPLKRLHQLKGSVDVRLPRDTPRGFYRPWVHVLARVAGVKDPVHLSSYADNWNEARYTSLPLVAVGQPATPHMPWSILAQVRYRGQAGVLPDEARRKVALVPRAGFNNTFIIKPGQYKITPSLPTVFPRGNMPLVSGGDVVIPIEMGHNLILDEGWVSCRVQGPTGKKNLGIRAPSHWDGEMGPRLKGGGFPVDMRRTGKYVVRMRGYLQDIYRRQFNGGGTYTVHVAHPLSFSTSCKPGASFLVGNSYPAKVMVNPPFAAEVEVEVRYFPNSDPARQQTWVAQGRANRFGHFSPHNKAPLVFDEPGEYISHVTARYTDRRGHLWMGQQSSTGVIAPQDPTLTLHGTRTFPYGLQVQQDYNGGLKRFQDRPDMTTSFLPFNPSVLPDPYVPYDPRDTLFVPSGGYNESLVEPHFSMAIKDPDLSERLQQANRVRSFLVPPMYQRSKGKWQFLRDVVQLSTDSGGWFPADKAHADELPILPVSRRGWHPFAFPMHNEVEAYTIMGVVRPGFPAMTSVYQRDAIGLYWLTSPNPFGYHFNNGPNGDLPGDLYRVQAGMVLKDHKTGKNHYDAYSAAIAVTSPSEGATAILPPGERPLVSPGKQPYHLFLALDTHLAMEVGETLGLGGMVFPAVEADVTWTVTTPRGETVVSRGKANRLGTVRGHAAVPLEEPGLYRIKTDVRHGKLRGGVVFTPEGRYWVCALPRDNPALLTTPLKPMTRVDAFEGLRIPISWPKRLTDVRLHWGVVMPGQVLDQGVVAGEGGQFLYPFVPTQLAVQFPNFDVRRFDTGQWELADTVVFQFYLEGRDKGKKVHDALRLVLRGDRLYNYLALMARPAGGAAPGHGHPLQNSK